MQNASDKNQDAKDFTKMFNMFQNKKVSDYDKMLSVYKTKKLQSLKGKIQAYVKLIPQICDSIVDLLGTRVLTVAEIESTLMRTVEMFMLSPFDIVCWVNYLNQINMIRFA